MRRVNSGPKDSKKKPMVNIFQRIEALEKELSILKAQLSWEQMTLPKCILEGYIAVNDYLAIVPSKEFGWELTLIFDKLRELNVMLAVLLMGPFFVLWFMTVLEWWRGVTN